MQVVLMVVVVVIEININSIQCLLDMYTMVVGMIIQHGIVQIILLGTQLEMVLSLEQLKQL